MGEKYIKPRPDSHPSGNRIKKIISIVIPTYNSSVMLLRCLKALEKQTSPKVEFEVIVSDDGSTDETLKELAQFKLKSDINLRWVSINNSGPACARNAGVAKSDGSWVGFMDSDVIPDKDWVKNAIHLINQNPDVGAFEGLTKVSQRNLASPFTHQTENIDGGRYPTCNFLVRRNLANFYPAYKIPFREDTDLAFGILALGYSIIFAPDLIVDHPPLNSNYFRPIILARRYYYDGLLARRFPERYRFDLDVHQILGFKIPHLKRKLYSIFVLSQILLLWTIFYDFSSIVTLLNLSIYIMILFISAWVGLRYTHIRNLSARDWVIFVFQLNILPWVMGCSLLRGWYDFNGEPEFKKW